MVTKRRPAGARRKIAPRSMAGFTYVGLLFVVVILGVVLSSAGVVWHTWMQQERERQLLFVGEQYRRAIASYQEVIQADGQRRLPRSFDELLEDRRFPMPVRHLRRRYVDPITNSREWGLVRIGEDIAGVYSLSEAVPVKKGNFGPCCDSFAQARSYASWKFIVAPRDNPAPGVKASQSGAN